ncbi:MAG: diacylglycerol kinase family protein [Bacteroidales bacterium]|nr:diacylglycerol kinase family protein [Bacteroidales bacterium]MBN2764537.1 diacylglycerol kinase family protein [Bacteroidales bacterium]
MKKIVDRFSVKSRIKSFYYAFRGLGSAFRQEHNLWIHTLAALVAVTAGFILGISLYEWMVIALVIGGVFVAELFNSAIESLVDLISPDFNKKAGMIKDMAAGAVLISAVTALVAGLIIFIPKLF